MRVVVADRAVESWPCSGTAAMRARARGAAVDDVRHLLAQRGRRRRLAVRARQHRQLGEVVRERRGGVRSRGRAPAADHRPRARRCSISAWERLLMSSEVQAKWMNSGDAGDFGIAGEALLQPVFDRLDVVIGARLDAP